MGRFAAIAPRGLEGVLAEELVELGVVAPEVGRGAVTFEGGLDVAYRVLLGARVPSRVLMNVARFEEGSLEALEHAAWGVDWAEHVSPDGTLVVDVAKAAGVEAHTRYVAQRTKDVVCDQLRERTGRRPSVDPGDPDLTIHVHLGLEGGALSIDLATSSLHRRGYRMRGAAAPLKENLAAALLRVARARERLREGVPLVDPMCGTGTFLVEAALMAMDVAPGTMLVRHGVERWRGHDARLFGRLLAEAKEKARAGRAACRPRLLGFDLVDAQLADLRRLAGELALPIEVQRRSVGDAAAPEGAAPGVVITNPPYGERLGTESELVVLYETLGDVLRRRFVGYDAYVLTSSKVLAGHLGLAASSRMPVWNGPLECRFLHLPIHAEAPKRAPKFREIDPEAEAFRNRLEKNLKTVGRRAERDGLQLYRLYDGDIPEYNVAVDRVGEHAVVQEYAAPPSVDPKVAARRLRDAVKVVIEVLGLPRECVHLAVRRRQTGGDQYERGTEAVVVEVREGPAVFEVRLGEHLDIGLFADHRILRKLAAEESANRTFLNLFAYTCAASVQAALAGARSTTSVDLSRTYLGWGERNFLRNGLDPRRHRLVQADCLAYLREAVDRFDVVFLNPPSYSRSHRMAGDFSVERDQAALVDSAMARVEPAGSLYFSTHARRFTLDPALREKYAVEDLSARSVPFDYVRSPHFAFRIRHRA